MQVNYSNCWTLMMICDYEKYIFWWNLIKYKFKNLLNFDKIDNLKKIKKKSYVFNIIKKRNFSCQNSHNQKIMNEFLVFLADNFPNNDCFIDFKIECTF